MMHIDYQYLEERTQKRSKRMGNLWGALLLVGVRIPPRVPFC